MRKENAMKKVNQLFDWLYSLKKEERLITTNWSLLYYLTELQIKHKCFDYEFFEENGDKYIAVIAKNQCFEFIIDPIEILKSQYEIKKEIFTGYNGDIESFYYVYIGDSKIDAHNVEIDEHLVMNWLSSVKFLN